MTRADQRADTPPPVCEIVWKVGPAGAMCLKCGHRFDEHRTEAAAEPADSRAGKGERLAAEPLVDLLAKAVDAVLSDPVVNRSDPYMLRRAIVNEFAEQIRRAAQSPNPQGEPPRGSQPDTDDE